MGKPKPPSTICKLVVTVTSTGGARVPFFHCGINDQDYVADNEGYLEVTLPNPKQYPIRITADGYVPYNGLVVVGYPITVWTTQLEVVNPGPTPPVIIFPTVDQIKDMKGDLCGISASGLPRFSSPSPYVFTPEYGVHTLENRKVIRDRYRAAFGDWATMPISLRNGAVYSDDYPSIDESQDQIFLLELYNDKIIPLCALMRDEDKTVDTTLPFALIKAAFVKWEQNQADNNNTQQMISETWQARQLLTVDAVLLVHYTDEHAAGIGDDPFWYCATCGNPYFSANVSQGEVCSHCHVPLSLIKVGKGESISPEAGFWQWAKKIGIAGIMYQDDRESNADVINRISDFTVRFGQGINGWPTGIWFFLFERGTESKYNNERSVEYWNTLNRAVLNNNFPGMQITGFCSGR